MLVRRAAAAAPPPVDHAAVLSEQVASLQADVVGLRAQVVCSVLGAMSPLCRSFVANLS